MASVASKMIEEVTAHAQSDSLEDAREICADGTYFPNNLRNTMILVYSDLQPMRCFHECCSSGHYSTLQSLCHTFYCACRGIIISAGL